MVDIYGSHFTFGDHASREFGLIIATEFSERVTAISGSINSVNIFNKNMKKNYLIDDDYSESPVKYSVMIITDDDRCLRHDELRDIEKWLFNRHAYKRLYIDFDDDRTADTYELCNGEAIRLYLNCRFVNAERLEYNGGIVGYRAEMETDSGYWWQEETEQEFSISNATAQSTTMINVDVDTDIDDYTYPDVIFTTGASGGDIQIINHTDDDNRITRINEIGANTQVIIKSGMNYISGGYYDKFVGMNFPRLLDGENSFQIIGDIATIKFRFQNRRFM